MRSIDVEGKLPVGDILTDCCSNGRPVKRNLRRGGAIAANLGLAILLWEEIIHCRRCEGKFIFHPMGCYRPIALPHIGRRYVQC